jgi:hypothetical protein
MCMQRTGSCLLAAVAYDNYGIVRYLAGMVTKEVLMATETVRYVYAM